MNVYNMKSASHEQQVENNNFVLPFPDQIT